MNIGFTVLFVAMLVPALMAVAFASRHWAALLWNFSWFLILARVGLEAFGSTWGAFPALVLAINYASRAMSERERPQFNFKIWQRGMAASGTLIRRGSAKQDEVIDAEFRREN